MKLFRNLAAAVIKAIEEILSENRYADRVVEKILKENPKWGSRDRKFIAETTYDIIRWRRLFEEAAGTNPWSLLAAWIIWKNILPPAWQEFREANIDKIKKFLGEPNLQRAVRESIPDWIDAVGKNALGDKWEIELKALNQQAPVAIRCNRIKINPKDLQRKLEIESIETITLPEHPDALVLKKRINIFRTESFKEGLFEVQDAGSQEIAPFCIAEPGMRIIDACAGAGGKALHLAALTQNKGKIIALDTEEWKLQELKKRARRAGIFSIEARVIGDKKVIKRLEAQADRLLLDVPCSGLGVLKRNPDAKWKLSWEIISKTIDLQRQILSEYPSMLKKGGQMVYATCSILPQENEDQIKWFLENFKEFELINERHLLPSSGTDGFYMARLKKKE